MSNVKRTIRIMICLMTFIMIPAGCYAMTDVSELSQDTGMSSAQEEYVKEYVHQAAQGCQGMTEEEKVRYICEWISDRLTYVRKESSLYEVIRTGEGKCVHYSQLFFLIGKEAGLEVETVRGVYDGYHQWNIVCIDGLWYNVDPTFYDSQKEENGYGDLWMLRGSKSFSKTHMYTGEYVEYFKTHRMARRDYRFDLFRFLIESQYAFMIMIILDIVSVAVAMIAYVRYFVVRRRVKAKALSLAGQTA